MEDYFYFNKKFSKAYEKKKDFLYEGAYIFKFCEAEVREKIEEFEKEDAASGLNMRDRVELEVWRNRLKDIENGKARGLYREFRKRNVGYMAGHAEAKTDEALSYLSAVMAERKQLRKSGFLGLKRRIFNKKLDKLREDCKEDYSNMDSGSLSKEFKDLDKLRDSVEGLLTQEDQVRYEVCKKCYERLKSAPHYSSAEIEYKKQHSYLSDKEIKQEMSKKHDKFMENNRKKNQELQEDAEFKKRVARRNARYEDQRLDF